ncbi:metallopeptidase family protein [soil metagenome]
MGATGQTDLMPIELDRPAFEALVDRALDTIPDAIAALVHNVVVLIEDEPPEDEPADTLGLYDGVALTERTWMPAVDLPDRILIFRNPLLDFCDSEQQLADEVRITVVHEIAHHFGMDHDTLESLGYG